MEKLKNILMATANVNLGAGASWSFIGLVKYVKEAGLNPIVIVRQKGGIYEEINKLGVKVYVIPQMMNRWMRHVNAEVKWRPEFVKCDLINLISMYRVKGIIKKENIQLVHMNSLTEYLCGKVATLKGIPIIWHIREFMEEDLCLTFVDNAKALSLINKADTIIAISDAVRNKYENLLERKIELVYNGIPIEQYYWEHTILEDKIVKIAISGRITESKGHFDLVKAIHILIQQGYKNIECNIFGEVHEKLYYEMILKYIEKNNLQKYIFFRGYYKDVSKELRKMDIQCVCSHKEAFGRVTIEGMLAGLLLVGANTGGTVELIHEKKTGLLYECRNPECLADVLRYAIDNRDEMKEIAKQAQIFAKDKFSDEKNANEIIKLFKQSLNSGRNVNEP